MNNKIRLLILLFLYVVITPVSAVRSSIVLFPLRNNDNNVINDWVKYLIPEYFSRKLSMIEGIRVWDPVFMFQTDSTGWDMQSDSLLMRHCTRWKWDACVGGSYSVDNDSIQITLKISWVTGTRQQVGMEIKKKALFNDCLHLCASLLLQTCSLLRYSINSEDSLRITRLLKVSSPAYFTYCAGYGFEMNGLFAEAQTAFSRALELDPAFTIARCHSGNIFLRTGNIKQARKVFAKLLRSKKHSLQTRAMTANFAVEQMERKQSFKYMMDSREELEKSAAGLLVIGKYYRRTGEFQRAIAVLRRAIAWGPSDLTAEYLLGVTYLQSGDYSVAIDLFNRLISMRPDYIRYQVSLGAVYRSAGRLMEALAVLETVRKREPDNIMVLIEIAHTYFALRWYRKAGQVLEQANRLTPNRSKILVDLGIVYWHENRQREAVECFRKAATNKAGRQASLVNTGNINLLSGDLERAVKAYQKAYTFGKNNPVVLYNLAMAHLKKGDKKRAVRYLDELQLLVPGRIDLLIMRAKIAQETGNVADAEIAYRSILENDPYNQMAIDGLIKLLIAQKRFEEATFRLEEYLEAMPARGDLMVLLADAYRKQEWFEVAIVKYQMVIRDFPEYGAGYLGLARCMYEMITNGKSQQYDETLYALKQASGKEPANAEPHIMMADIYKNYKHYTQLAVEQWRKALEKTSDRKERKMIEDKISAAGR